MALTATSEARKLRAKLRGHIPPSEVLDQMRRYRDAIDDLQLRADTDEERAKALAAFEVLPPAFRQHWKHLSYHPKQREVWDSKARNRILEVARRSGKTWGRKGEIAQRACDPDWIGFTEFGLSDRFIVIGLPTQQQTADRYLDDLLKLIPRKFRRAVRLSDPPMIVTLTGTRIILAGMDCPERAEGDPIDDLFLDEMADMRKGRRVIDDHLAPALDTPGRPPGTTTAYGCPDLRSGADFIDLCDQWKAKMLAGDPDYGYWTWTAEGIMSPTALEKARENRDWASFAVEYLAQRVSTGLLVYYCWRDDLHRVPSLRILPDHPVTVCLDFNRDPGTAVIVQEQSVEDYLVGDPLPSQDRPEGSDSPILANKFTAVLGEVFVRNSTTPEVCREVVALLAELGHRGPVDVTGDATGCQQQASSIAGSAITLVRQTLEEHLGEDRVSMMFRSVNPREGERVDSVNNRLRNAKGVVRLLVDESRCPETIRDFQMVQVKEGSRTQQIDKDVDKLRTHLCFHGDTLVETPGGAIALRDIPESGLVRGPLGQWVAYRCAGRTLRNAPMVDVVANGIGVIRCTPWHLMLTLERGWVRADHLEGLTLAFSFDLMECRNSSVRSITGTVDTSSAAETGCTGLYGSTTTDYFLAGADGMFTTSTKTGRTTRSRTSNSFLRRITCRITGKVGRKRLSRRCGSSSTSTDQKLPHGTGAPREGLGIGCMPSAASQSLEQATALGAASSSSTSFRRQRSARRTARPSTGITTSSTMRRELASCAARSFRRTDTREPSAALGRVVGITPTERSDAYCLWVPGYGAFALASGAVVSNCDGLGYYVHQNFPADDHDESHVAMGA